MLVCDPPGPVLTVLGKPDPNLGSGNMLVHIVMGGHRRTPAGGNQKYGDSKAEHEKHGTACTCEAAWRGTS